MKKIIIVLLLILIIASPCYAVNVFDTIIYKKVLLCASHMTVLVNRITGELKYIMLNNGKWVLLSGTWKSQCQSMYEAQIALKIECH